MNENELDRLIRAWYRTEVSDAETAPPGLRFTLANLPAGSHSAEGRVAAPDWRPLVNRIIPLGLAAGALIVALVIGIGVLGRPPSDVGSTPVVPPSPTSSVQITVSPSPQTTEPAAWIATGGMITARFEHAATILDDGRVLVAGGTGIGQGEGLDSAAYLSSAELFDPDTGTWSAAGSMSVGRIGHTLTLLSDGKVLAAGGSARPLAYGELAPTLLSAEIYDPRTGAWTVTDGMTTARTRHSATLLEDGTVIVAGGFAAGEDALASTEVYDPGSGEWTRAESMIAARVAHAAVRLSGGSVLVAGGSGPPEVRDAAELYDPSTGRWTSAGRMSGLRFSPAATLLADGRVLVMGSMLSHGDLYDEQTGTWTVTSDAPLACSDSRAVLLPDGRVLETCSSVDRSTRLYDPLSDSWTQAGTMEVVRHWHSATTLGDGRVLVAGGSGEEGIQASAELYGAPAGP